MDEQEYEINHEVNDDIDHMVDEFDRYAEMYNDWLESHNDCNL